VVPWLTGLAPAAKPEVVLLLAGTNDVTDSPNGIDPPPVDTQPAADALGNLIGAIATAAPDAEILVGTLPPHLLYNDRVVSYNAKLPAVIAARAGAGDNVRLVNTGEVIVVDDLEDVEHPGPFGYGKIADVWFRALVDSYPALAPVPAPQVATDNFDRADGPLGTAPTGQSWTTSASWQIVGNEASTTDGSWRTHHRPRRRPIRCVGLRRRAAVADERHPVALVPSRQQQPVSARRHRPTSRRQPDRTLQARRRRVTALQLTTGTGFAPGVDYRLRVEASGALVQVWLDDVMWIQHTLSPLIRRSSGRPPHTGSGPPVAPPRTAVHVGTTSRSGRTRPCRLRRRAPAAPAAPSAVAGDRQVLVTWAAPAANGSPITGYTVTAAPGGATCTTTGALSCTVGGLTNGTAYTFTVVATNAIGNLDTIGTFRGSDTHGTHDSTAHDVEVLRSVDACPVVGHPWRTSRGCR
jgi:hypothetical protein